MSRTPPLAEVDSLPYTEEKTISLTLKLIEQLPYACVPEDVVASLRQLPRNQTLADLKEIIILAQDPDLSTRAMDAILQIDPEFSKSVLLEVRGRPEWEWFFCYASIAYSDDSFIAPFVRFYLTPKTLKQGIWLRLHCNGMATETQSMRLL